MGQFKRVTGLASGAIDLAKADIRFALSRANGDTFDLVANIPAVEQIIGALARMSAEASARLAGQSAAMAAETLAAAELQRDQVGTKMVLTLISDRGVPFRFAIDAQQAANIAARLQTESARARPSGNA